LSGYHNDGDGAPQLGCSPMLKAQNMINKRKNKQPIINANSLSK